MDNITATAKMRIDRPAETVFEAFVEPGQMTKFWFPKCSGPLQTDHTVYWYTGVGKDACEIPVTVVELVRPERIQIAWGSETSPTRVNWSFEPQSDCSTIVRIVESGYTGSVAQIIAQALDSAGGFNQVLTAAKALLEHDVAVNVVEAHVD